MSNLTAISPFFIVADVTDSVLFYTDKLGFKVMYLNPDEELFFAIMERDNISIMLKAIADDIKPVPNHTRHEWARWDAFIYTADPDALFKEYQSNGVTFRQPLQDDGDGLRGF